MFYLKSALVLLLVVAASEQVSVKVDTSHLNNKIKQQQQQQQQKARSGSLAEAFEPENCENVPGFTDELIKEIKSHQEAVSKIIDLVLRGDEKHSTYNELAYFTDRYGPRLSGSDNLSDAIAHMLDKMRNDAKLDNVHGEAAQVPKWTPGKQWAEMTHPVSRPMNIIALGMSVGTNGTTLEAPVIVVHSFDELEELGKAGKINGKIVVYNYNFTNYVDCVKYRTEGALKAAKYKAKAALVRSVTDFSIYSAHAGAGSRSIPTAAITIEDADQIQRWLDRGEKVRLKLYMEAQNFDPVTSHNVIGDITGSENPEHIVLISGHIDSWYNTNGAMDDGGGMMISYKAANILRKLNLRAKRTIRAVLWTCEEFGYYGAKQYIKDHASELDNFKIVFESDLGTFTPLGLSFINFSKLGQCVLKEVLKLTQEIGTTHLSTTFEGSDVDLFTDKGTPGISLYNKNARYFWFHHTSGDSMTMQNPDDMDMSTILWAAASYVLADLSVDVKG